MDPNAEYRNTGLDRYMDIASLHTAMEANHSKTQACPVMMVGPPTMTLTLTLTPGQKEQGSAEAVEGGDC